MCFDREANNGVIMKKVLILLSCILLNACVSMVVTDTRQQQEKILSILYHQQNNLMYAIGENYSFQLQPCKPTLQSYNQTPFDPKCLESIDLLLEDAFTGKIIAAQLMLFIRQGDVDAVHGNYRVYLRLTDAEYQEYVARRHLKIRTLDTQDHQYLNKRSALGMDTQNVYVLNVHFDGQGIELKNKQQILEQAQFKQAVIAVMHISTVEKHRSVGDFGQMVTSGATAVVLAPIGLALMLPYAAVMAVCESGNHC